MTIVVNGEERSVPDGITVRGLIDELGIRAEALAVERNRAIVPKREYDSCVLEGGDRLEIVTFVGGG